jgi:hypothetical protein
VLPGIRGSFERAKKGLPTIPGGGDEFEIVLTTDTADSTS